MDREETKPAKAVNAKRRDDDGRGCKPGEATMERPNGSRIGNPPFVPTDEQREKVRTYAKVFPPHAQRNIALLIGCSEDTLQRHFRDDIDLGRAEMLASVGSQMISRALNADKTGPDGTPIAKGDLDAQKFILARLGGWSTKVEMTGKGGGPIESVDLSKFTPEQLAEYGRLAAIAEGVDPEDVVDADSDT